MIVLRTANMDMTGEILTQSDKKIAEEYKKALLFIVTDDDGKKFEFNNRMKALRFARRIGSTDIVMCDPDQDDAYIYDPVTKFFVYL